MPGINLDEISIKIFTRGLKTLLVILTKAEEHAKSQGQDPDSLVSQRLTEGMLPLSFQIQVVSNTVKKCLWRMTGVEIESWEDNETTFAQLKARVQRTQDLVAGIDIKTVNGKEDNIVTLEMGKSGGSMNLPAKDYVQNYAIPNFYFHLQTTYCILRMKGVPLGKVDYLTPFLKGDA